MRNSKIRFADERRRTTPCERGFTTRNFMHDAVRRTAVAPKPKKGYRKSATSTHADDPLSDGENDNLQKIRSYIKPNKNINTYNQALRDERLLFGSKRTNGPLLRNERSIPLKPWSDSSKSKERKQDVPPVVNRTVQFPRVSPPGPKLFATTTSNADERKRTPSCVTDQTARHPKEGVMPNDPRESSNPLKRRSIPKPPPLPSKKFRRSSPCRVPPQSHNNIPDPCRSTSSNTVREKCSTSWHKPSKSGVYEEASQPSKQEQVSNIERSRGAANSHCSTDCSDRQSDSFSKYVSRDAAASETNPKVGSSAAGTDIVWNEPANLAHLHNLRLGILNLCTLPDEGKWYLEEFPKVLVRERNSSRKSRNDSNGSDSNVVPVDEEPHASSSFTGYAETQSNNTSRLESAPGSRAKEDSNQFGAYSAVSLSHEVSRTGECEASHKTFAMSSLDSVRKQLSTLRSCFTMNKKSPRKQVRFSENLVTFFIYDASDQELSRIEVGESMAELHHSDFELGCQRSYFSQEIPAPLPLKPVKIEVEDDEVQVLFSGKVEYIEALRREKCGMGQYLSKV